METQIVPAYFYGRLGAVAYEEGTLVAVHDPWEQQCIAVDQGYDKKEAQLEKDREALKGSWAQAKASVKKESQSWLSKLLWGSKSSPARLTGCAYSPDEACQGSTSPKLARDYALSIPEVINEEDLAAGKNVAWLLYATNCDDSADGVKVKCLFTYRDGTSETEEFTAQQDGTIKVQKTLYKKMDGAAICDLYFQNPNSDSQPDPWLKAITLHPPTVISSSGPSTTSDTCYSLPEPSTTVMVPNITSVVQGSNLPICWIKPSVRDCNNQPLTLKSNDANLALFNPDHEYNETATPLALKACGSILPTVSGGGFSFNFEYQSSDGLVILPKSIAFYLPTIEALKVQTPDSYITQGESVAFASQTVPGALSYYWKVTKGSSTVDESYTALSNTTFSPDQTGWHTMQLDVLTSTADTVSATRNFFVNETSVVNPTPSLSIVAPFSGTVSTGITFQVGAPDTVNFDYSWNFGDSTPAAAGTSVSHTFTSSGTYSVILTATLKSDSSIYHTSQPHTISISSTPVPLPVISATHNPATGPGSGYNIDFDATGSYSPIAADITSYTIVYGDGASETNTSGTFSHAYPNPGAGNSANYSALLTIKDEYNVTNSTSILVAVWGD